MSYSNELKNKIMEAFGNTKEIQNAFLLHLQELFDFLYHRFNSSLLSKEQSISRLNSIILQSNTLKELSLLIQES